MLVAFRLSSFSRQGKTGETRERSDKTFPGALRVRVIQVRVQVPRLDCLGAWGALA